jgi:hypothetical protein
VFEPLGHFGSCLGMLAPFNLEFQMVRRNSAAALVVADPLVNHGIHATNQMIGRDTSLRVRRAPQLSIDYVAHALEHAAHNALGHDRVAAPLGMLILFVSHFSVIRVPQRTCSEIDYYSSKIHYFCVRCLAASYKITPVATATLRLSVFPCIGIRTAVPAAAISSADKPSDSGPMIKATDLRQSMSV